VKKRLSMFLIAMLVGGLVLVTILQFGIVRAESSSITKPSVPEFTVKLVDYSYDVAATQSVDPYTGETVTIPAHRVENRSIEVRIKNQPFTPYQIRDSNGNEWTVNFFYNIRVKGHFGQYWTEVFHPSDGFPIQSDSEYTVISFSSTGGEDFYATSTSVVHAPTGGQVDFQVEAMIGYVHREISIPVPGTGWLFTGETSGWSNTQTITIDANPSTVPSSASSDSQNPTASSDQSGLNWTEIALFTALGVIVALVIVVIALVRRRKSLQNANSTLPKSKP